MKRKIILPLLFCLSCSGFSSSDFKNFSEWKAEKKIAFLGSLLGDEKKPFENQKIQRDLLRILKNHSETPQVRVEAFNTLSMATSGDFTKAFLNLLKNKETPIGLKTNLALKLGEKVSQDKSILDYFIKKLNDPVEPDGVRLNVAMALGDRNLVASEDLIQTLVKAYENEQNYESIRINAVTSLTSFRNDPMAKQAIEKVIQGGDVTLRLGLAQHFRDDVKVEFKPWLEALVNDPSPEVAQEAKQALQWYQKAL